jgi:hypothetical protein
MLADQTRDDLTPETVVRDDFAFVMERYRNGAQDAGRMLLIITSGGLVVAILSVFANLGVIDLTKIKYKDVEIILQKLIFVRLFLTCASVGCAIAVAHYNSLGNYYQAVIEFLAKEKKYGRAMIMMEFRQWPDAMLMYSNYTAFHLAFVLMVVGLLVILPLVTFAFSIFSN